MYSVTAVDTAIELCRCSVREILYYVDNWKKELARKDRKLRNCRQEIRSLHTQVDNWKFQCEMYVNVIKAMQHAKAENEEYINDLEEELENLHSLQEEMAAAITYRSKKEN